MIMYEKDEFNGDLSNNNDDGDDEEIDNNKENEEDDDDDDSANKDEDGQQREKEKPEGEYEGHDFDTKQEDAGRDEVKGQEEIGELN